MCSCNGGIERGSLGSRHGWLFDDCIVSRQTDTKQGKVILPLQEENMVKADLKARQHEILLLSTETAHWFDTETVKLERYPVEIEALKKRIA